MESESISEAQKERSKKKQDLKLKKLNLTQRTAFFYLALISLFIGLIWLLINVYKIDLFQANTNLYGDLIAAIIGIPGLWFSLSGLLFVVDNLNLQRNTLLVQIDSNELLLDDLEQQINEWKDSTNESKIQNATLEQQQADNTFFNLLTLFKELMREINNEINLSELENSNLIYNKEYFVYANSYTFPNFNSTLHNPFYKYNIDIKNNNLFKMFAVNANDIINFIDDRFKTRTEFYHKIFYNLLSPAEKFFIGFFIEFELYNFKNTTSFNYKDYYNTKGLLKNNINYFPAISVSTRQVKTELTQLDSVKLFSILHILNIDNIEKLKISKVKRIVKRNDFFIEDFIENETSDNLGKKHYELNDIIKNMIESNAHQGLYELILEFSFDFFDNKILIPYSKFFYYYPSQYIDFRDEVKGKSLPL